MPSATVSGTRYDALRNRALSRDYPAALRRLDSELYALLGVVPASRKSHAVNGSYASRAWYDSTRRRLLLRRVPKPGRAGVIHELVRALVDQSFNLRRLTGLRARDRDRAIAADGMVEGTAALASRVRGSAALNAGRALAAELRYLGGQSALRTALRTFPQTTEQLLHVDKFLERESALPVSLSARIGSTRLDASQTFGELDVRELLRVFAVRDATSAAEGWGGGRLARYVTAEGDPVAALVLHWDTRNEATQWRDAVARYVEAAFGDATPRDCPPLDRCWSGSAELAAGVLGDRSVFVSGPDAALVAAELLN